MSEKVLTLSSILTDHLPSYRIPELHPHFPSGFGRHCSKNVLITLGVARDNPTLVCMPHPACLSSLVSGQCALVVSLFSFIFLGTWATFLMVQTLPFNPGIFSHILIFLKVSLFSFICDISFYNPYN